MVASGSLSGVYDFTERLLFDKLWLGTDLKQTRATSASVSEAPSKGTKNKRSLLDERIATTLVSEPNTSVT